jgi:hypothetical protein
MSAQRLAYATGVTAEAWQILAPGSPPACPRAPRRAAGCGHGPLAIGGGG